MTQRWDRHNNMTQNPHADLSGPSREFKLKDTRFCRLCEGSRNNLLLLKEGLNREYYGWVRRDCYC